MSTYGLFQPSVLGMNSQSHAMQTIATNISNLRTGGYKRTDVDFSTVLSRAVSSQTGGGDVPAGTSHADLGGARPLDRQRVSLQGLVESTARDLDVAINGRGFFVLNTQADGSGETLYGRDGRFSLSGATDGASDGYLIDKNGYYVQGFSAAGDGAAFETVRLDGMTTPGQATGLARLSMNLPADTQPGGTHTHVIDVFDSAAGRRDLSLQFTRSQDPNTWAFDVDSAAGDAVTLAGSSAPATLQFGADGYVDNGGLYNVDIAHADGATSAFTLDLSGFTQFGGPLLTVGWERDGFPAGSLESLEFDPKGNLLGNFDNAQSMPLYRLAMADFANPDSLEARSGNVYAASGTSGGPEYGGAGDEDLGGLMPQAHELSNVELAQEFTRMTMTQSAYNASATSFKTLDEMTQTVRDLG